MKTGHNNTTRVVWALGEQFFPSLFLTLVVACDYNNGPNNITLSSKDFQYLLLSKKILTCASEVVINTVMNRKENVNYRIIYTHGAGDWCIRATTIKSVCLCPTIQAVELGKRSIADGI